MQTVRSTSLFSSLRCKAATSCMEVLTRHLLTHGWSLARHPCPVLVTIDIEDHFKQMNDKRDTRAASRGPVFIAVL